MCEDFFILTFPIQCIRRKEMDNYIQCKSTIRMNDDLQQYPNKKNTFDL